MRLVNIPRATAENMPWAVGPKDWLIAIHSSGGSPSRITAPFGAVHHFCFDDVNDDADGRCITECQAAEIGSVIRSAEAAGVSTLWVHCDAGICRSGAVVEAAALLGHVPDDDVSSGRVPRSLVFTRVRKALGLKHSWEE